MKKALASVICLVAVLALALSSCSLLPSGDIEAEAASVFTIDVNPSIKVYVNENDEVIELEANNEDGEAIIAKIVFKGKDYEEVVEIVIDEMEIQGYIEDTVANVLITFEKEKKDISDKLNQKLDEVFTKHEKRLEVIEQHIDDMEKEFKEEIEKLAKDHNMSEGKARLIEKIREEFPEYTVEELANLSLSDLRLILEETSEDVKDCFHKLGEAIEDIYLGKEAALETALSSLSITIDDVRGARVKYEHDDGRMIYEVEFIYGENEYEIEIDAETGTIIETECEPHKELDLEDIIDDFCDHHGFDKDNFLGGIIGSDIFDKFDDYREDAIAKRGEILDKVIAFIDALPEAIESTEIELHKDGNNSIYEVEIELTNGDEYEFVIEASTGAFIKATLNDVAIEITVEDDAA